MTITLKGMSGIEYDVHEWDIAGWQRVYTHIDVRAEVEKMALWLEANPKRRKRDTKRFLINWLSKADEKAPTHPVTASRAYAQRVQAEHHKRMSGERARPDSPAVIEARRKLESMGFR